MAIVNVTPDSFSENGVNYDPHKAIENALRMVTNGADILDIGGESTRPGASPVAESEEIKRVVPVIEGLRKETNVLISIDTTKANVAQAALDVGADIINDISGMKQDPNMPSVAINSGASCILMHMKGTPQTMQQYTEYSEIVHEINQYFGTLIELYESMGIQREKIAIDPGIGFSKTVEQNLELIARLDQFHVHGCPILLGPSRKSFIGKTLGQPKPEDRLLGTAASVAYGIERGARIMRVHDVIEMMRGLNRRNISDQFVSMPSKHQRFV